MSTREEFEAWAISVGVVLSTQEDGTYTYASMRFALDAYQAATSRQDAKIKALRASLNWALSNISEEPYEWSSEEDADAHNAAIAAAKETP